jgi:hypothetical protein
VKRVGSRARHGERLAGIEAIAVGEIRGLVS